MNREGFIRLSRRAFQHFLWREPREKTRWEAWIDLIQTAAYAPNSALVEGRRLNLARGELVASVRFLAARWDWDKNKVARFLAMLKSESMIRTRIETGINVISLCKYDQYNPVEDGNGTVNGTDSGQTRDSDGTKIRSKEGNQSTARVPTLEQAMAFAPSAGVDPKAAECWWLDCDARPLSPSGNYTGKDGVEIRNWKSALTSYGRKWQSNDLQRNGSGHARPVKTHVEPMRGLPEP